MRMPTWRSSFVAALVVVTIAMFSAAVLGNVSKGPIVTAPIVPAMYLIYAMFIGGPHGDTLGYYQEASLIFVIALLLWWALFEGCRQLWTRLGSRPTATRPPD
jgi:cobalamin synthase